MTADVLGSLQSVSESVGSASVCASHRRRSDSVDCDRDTRPRCSTQRIRISHPRSPTACDRGLLAPYPVFSPAQNVFMKGGAAESGQIVRLARGRTATQITGPAGNIFRPSVHSCHRAVTQLGRPVPFGEPRDEIAVTPPPPLLPRQAFKPSAGRPDTSIRAYTARTISFHLTTDVFAMPGLKRFSAAARSRFAGPARSEPGAWARTSVHCRLGAGFRRTGPWLRRSSGMLPPERSSRF